MILSVAFAMFVFAGDVNAQTSTPTTPAPTPATAAPATTPATPDFFVGKWKSMIKGIPQGDTETTFVFEKIDGKLTGSMIDPKENKTTKFDTVTVKDGVLTTTFTAQGFEVSLSLKKQDDDNFKGSMMEQFDVTGSRIK